MKISAVRSPHALDSARGAPATHDPPAGTSRPANSIPSIGKQMDTSAALGHRFETTAVHPDGFNPRAARVGASPDQEADPGTDRDNETKDAPTQAAISPSPVTALGSGGVIQLARTKKRATSPSQSADSDVDDGDADPENDASEGIAEGDEAEESDESAAEDFDDDDWQLSAGSKRLRIDPRTHPDIDPPIVDKKTGKTTTTWSNPLGVQATVEQQGAVTKTQLSGMSALPPGFTARRDPLEGKISLHSEKKGAGGGRKHNPNDTHSTHTAGMAMFGVPSQPGLGTGHDASAQYNRQYYPHEVRLRAKPGRKWSSRSEVETENLNTPARIKAIMDDPARNPKLTKARLTKRLDAHIAKNPETKGIKRARIEYSSDRGEVVDSGDLGRDIWKGAKEKWFTDDYDPDDSSSDEDVRKGKRPKK